MSSQRRILAVAVRVARWIGQHPFLLIAGVLVFAAVCRAALTVDGSYFLFSQLTNDQLLIPNHRWLHAILPLPALLISRVSGDIGLIALVFNLAYTLMPLGALLTAGIVASGRPGRPFVWAAVGICIVTLPGQIVFISEGAVALQWAWALWITCAYGVRRRDVPLLVPVCLVIAFSHPTGPLLFVIAAGLAAVRAWSLRVQHQGERRASLGLAALMLACAGLNALRVALAFNVYEAAQVSSFGLMATRFIYSVIGAQAVMLLGAFGLMAGWVLPAARRIPWRLWVALVIGGGGVYALVPKFWMGALDYRFFALALSVPFVALMALDASRPNPRAAAIARRLSGVFVLTFVLVVGVQSAQWMLLRAGVRDATLHSASLADSTDADQGNYPCADIDDVPLGRDSILYHWSITSLSLLEGGQSPSRIVLWVQPCAPEAFAEGIPVSDWLVQTEAGWFDWSELLARLRRVSP